MKQQIEQLKMQLGWQGIVGVLLLLLTWGFHLEILQPMERETDYLRGRINQGQVREDSRGLRSSGFRQNDLERFYDSLPVERDVTDILASIAAVAEASSVELKQAEYRVNKSLGQAAEYNLYYPVQGGYANIRHFVFRVLADHPALALDQISFQRDKVNDAILKAEVRLTLFIRAN